MHKHASMGFILAVIITACTFIGQPVNASEGGYVIRDHVREVRDRMAAQGFAYEITYTWDYYRNVAGGLKREGTNLRNLDLTLSLDTGAAGLWPDGELFLYILDNSGGRKLSGDIVGDVQTVSNIEAPRTTRIYELWYQQRISDRLSVLAGFHDYNSEFNVVDSAGLFLNSSFGIQPDISAVGRPSIFPLAGLGVRLKFVPSANHEYLFAVYDGDPGDPDDQEHFPRVELDGDGGAFYALETAYHFSTDRLPGKVKLGMWYNSGEFTDVVSDQPADGNWGGYVLAEKQVFHTEDSGPEVTVFMQFGANDADVNEIDMYVGGGVNIRGLIPGRDADEMGLAVAHARINSDLTGTGARDDSETAVEWTYSIQLNDTLRIQPDLQYIRNPGAVTGRENAVIAAVRVELAL